MKRINEFAGVDFNKQEFYGLLKKRAGAGSVNMSNGVYSFAQMSDAGYPITTVAYDTDSTSFNLNNSMHAPSMVIMPIYTFEKRRLGSVLLSGKPLNTLNNEVESLGNLGYSRSMLNNINAQINKGRSLNIGVDLLGPASDYIITDVDNLNHSDIVNSMLCNDSYYAEACMAFNNLVHVKHSYKTKKLKKDYSYEAFISGYAARPKLYSVAESDLAASLYPVGSLPAGTTFAVNQLGIKVGDYFSEGSYYSSNGIEPMWGGNMNIGTNGDPAIHCNMDPAYGRFIDAFRAMMLDSIEPSVHNNIMGKTTFQSQQVGEKRTVKWLKDHKNADITTPMLSTTPNSQISFKGIPVGKSKYTIAEFPWCISSMSAGWSSVRGKDFNLSKSHVIVMDKQPYIIVEFDYTPITVKGGINIKTVATAVSTVDSSKIKDRNAAARFAQSQRDLLSAAADGSATLFYEIFDTSSIVSSIKDAPVKMELLEELYTLGESIADLHGGAVVDNGSRIVKYNEVEGKAKAIAAKLTPSNMNKFVYIDNKTAFERMIDPDGGELKAHMIRHMKFNTTLTMNKVTTVVDGFNVINYGNCKLTSSTELTIDQSFLDPFSSITNNLASDQISLEAVTPSEEDYQWILSKDKVDLILSSEQYKSANLVNLIDYKTFSKIVLSILWARTHETKTSFNYAHLDDVREAFNLNYEDSVIVYIYLAMSRLTINSATVKGTIINNFIKSIKSLIGGITFSGFKSIDGNSETATFALLDAVSNVNVKKTEADIILGTHAWVNTLTDENAFVAMLSDSSSKKFGTEFKRLGVSPQSTCYQPGITGNRHLSQAEKNFIYSSFLLGDTNDVFDICSSYVFNPEKFEDKVISGVA